MIKPIVIGIDPSSKKLAMVITQDGNADIDMRMYKFHQRDKIKAAGQAYSAIEDVIKDYAEHRLFIFMEAPIVAFKAGAASVIPQAQIGGAVMAACYASDIDLTLCDQAKWKQEVLGKSNIKKESIGGLLGEFWPKAFNQINEGGYLKGDIPDFYDAACINQYGHRLVARAETLSHGVPKKKTRIRRRA